MATNKVVEEVVQYYGTGRRKASVARVILTAGEGKVVVNDVEVSKYFPHETLVMDLKRPLVLTGCLGKFDVTVNVYGGGFTGQSGAIRLGIARALLEVSDDMRKMIKVEGLLTRDARSKERKKYGLKSARRAPQFSKR